MTVRSFEQHRPRLAEGAWVDPSAVIVGDVELQEDVSIWPQSVVRGDIQAIRIGARSNIQDGTVIHVTHDSRFCPGGRSTQIGSDVTVGHRAVLHACSIGDLVLVGMQVTVLDGAVVEARCMIGAGSLVPPGKRLRAGYLYVGNPVAERRPLSDRELEFLSYSATHYVKLKNRHVASARDS